MHPLRLPKWVYCVEYVINIPLDSFIKLNTTPLHCCPFFLPSFFKSFIIISAFVILFLVKISTLIDNVDDVVQKFITLCAVCLNARCSGSSVTLYTVVRKELFEPFSNVFHFGRMMLSSLTYGVELRNVVSFSSNLC